jgi:hypothetical protein
MLLETDQVSFTLGGIPFGQVDEFGVDWSIEQLEGWTGSTRSTSEVTQKPRQSGGWRSSGYSGARSISASGKIFAPDAAALSDAFDRLNAALPAGVDIRIAVTDAAGTRWVTVQQSDDVLTNWLMPDVGTWSIQVSSTDWRKFGEELSAVTQLPSTSGGIVIGGADTGSSSGLYTADQAQAAADAVGLMVDQPTDGLYPLLKKDGSPASAQFVDVLQLSGAFTVPFIIDAKTITGQVSLTNPGNESGTVVLRIEGPCVGPVVTHVSTGNAIVFSSSLVLREGEFLEIDMDARTALANGQSNRAGYITSRGWSAFDPGRNTWAFSAAQYNSQSQLSVTAVPAWR